MRNKARFIGSEDKGCSKKDVQQTPEMTPAKKHGHAISYPLLWRGYLEKWATRVVFGAMGYARQYVAYEQRVSSVYTLAQNQYSYS